MTAPTSWLDADGCRLAYRREGAGPRVLLLQGVGLHGEGWRPQLDALLPDHDCLWFDNRGVGASQPAAARLSVRTMADDALALMDACAWPDAHVVGHSLGGIIALRLALGSPTRVRSLGLLCTFSRGRDAGASARMAWIGLRTRVGTRRMRRAAFLEILAAPSQLAGRDRDRMARDMAPLFGHDLADHPAIEGRQLSALRAEDTTPELARLAGIPTLVMSAAHDPISPPAVGRALADAVPGSRYVLLAGQAHGAPILAAEAVNALLREHLSAADAVPARDRPSPGPLQAVDGTSAC
jgi:aminoacrylate hydrolase